VPSAAHADVPGSSTPPLATADDKPTIGTFAPKGAPPSTPGVSTKSKISAKAAAGATPCPDPNPCYFYNTAYEDAKTTGIFANMWIGNPTVVAPDSHSLAELTAIKHTNDSRQIVEVGWTVDRVMYGDGLPHLFVYKWVNGEEGCFNGCGWIASDDAKHRVGEVLTSGVYKQFGIQYDAESPAGGGWWIKYDGEFLGYFPSSLWTKANPAVNDFTDTDNVQAFGEVAAGTTGPCSNLGVNGSKGAAGAAGIPRPAFIGSIAYVNGPSAAPAIFVSPDTAGDAYSINVPGAPKSSRTFYYGGGGFC
jgi:hypothetical protein